MGEESRFDRREFIAGSAGVVAAGLAAEQASASGRRAKVVVVTGANVIDRDKPVDRAVLRRMMDRGIMELSGKRTAVEGWKTYVRPTDSVALVDSGTWLLNVPEVVCEIARGIKQAGPRAMKLTYCALAERNAAYLGALRAGLPVAGVDADVMDGTTYTIPGKFSERDFTLIVNTPTLKSHTICGVSGVVKHYATMSKTHVRNYHGDSMASAGAALRDEFMGLRHLIIVDALRLGKVTEGPQFYQKSLIFGTDPVATDVIALEVFLRNCETHGRIPPEKHRQLAGTQYGAGIADRARIDVEEVRV